MMVRCINCPERGCHERTRARRHLAFIILAGLASCIITGLVIH